MSRGFHDPTPEEQLQMRLQMQQAQAFAGAPPPQMVTYQPPSLHGKGGLGKGGKYDDGLDHSQVEAALYDIVNKIMPMETEFPADKMIEKLWMNLWKGKKALNFECGLSWKQLVTEYADKFYSALWCAFGDRQWLEKLDFTPCFSASVQTYFPPNMNSSVSAMDFANVLISAPEAANDYARYYYNAPDIIKRYIEGKSTVKKVMNGLEESREELLKAEIMDVNEYIEKWATATLRKIGAGSHPMETVETGTITRMFNELCTTGNCVPSSVQKMSGMQPISSDEVCAAVQRAIDSFGPLPVYEPKVKQPKGKGYGGGCAGGGKGWGGGWAAEGGMIGGKCGGKGKDKAKFMQLMMMMKGDGGGFGPW